ncbi:MAG: class I SAM-dependent methyltransferase [Deltaproteobacteria bacterium]|nr:class I SAM-dependent methyltransferase [Deltaproteobacteria bacterium]
MKPGRPSFTAEGAAAIRALETLRPLRLRIFEDPYASAFLSRRTRWRTWVGLRLLIERLMERALPGVIPFTVARARWMDDLLVELAPRAEQIVILGAGYDTTFARHPELPRRLAYFEVDHPDTGQAKRARIAARPELFGDSYDKVRSVAVNFERENLIERLGENGFDLGKQTVYVWSGVIPYLERSAVESTLRQLARSASGSHIMADLVAARGLKHKHASRTLRYFKKLGESIRFMMDPEDLKTIIAPVGLHVESVVMGESLREMYFKPEDPRRVSKFAYLVHLRTGSG